MASKLQEAYELVFLVFKQWIEKENIPKKITLDFELGLLNAAESVLSVDTEIIGCYFHFKQCLRRKFLNLGVTQEECHVLLAQIGFITIINEPDLPLSLTFFEEKVLRTFPHLSEAIKEIEIYFKTYWAPKFSYWNISRFPATSHFKRTNNCFGKIQ